MSDQKQGTNHPWRKLELLRDPFNDAINYKTRKEKDFFNQIFLRTNDLFDCLKPSVYFLIGEKGSGKTAYASYLENNDVDAHRCKLSTMTESQYKRFIAMKRQGKLDYSDYANIWRPILLAMVAQTIVEKSKGLIDGFTNKFDELEAQIAEFNKGALNPEVEVAFQLVTNMSDKLTVGPKQYAQVSLEDGSKTLESTEVIKHHLLDKEGALKEAIGSLSLRKNHILFMDGIDYRPESVPYPDYLACVKGLGEAAWQLNSEYFSNIRDSKGRIKIVLLVRPDVFHSMNLYNSNSRLRDNSVLLDWTTTESDMRGSLLYEAADKFFASQQDFETTSLQAADHYLSAFSASLIFKTFLRISFQKPRDLLTLISIARNISIKRLRRGQENKIGPDILKSPFFTREYADYMFGEVRNYAAFYMSQGDFAKYMKFFQYLDGKSEFSYGDFSIAFNSFKKWANGESLDALEYIRDPEALLQFFYDVNVIGYTEDVGSDSSTFYHFAFRERTLTNIAPKIKMSGTLVINRGLSKALDIGLQSQLSKAASGVVGQSTRSRPKKNAKFVKPAMAVSKEIKPIPPIESDAAIPASKKKRRRRRKKKPVVPEKTPDL